MEEAVFISICIPAYKRSSFVKRLLDSIQIQTYGHFEVIITDDSPDNAVFELTRDHPLGPLIRYFKNEKPLGTPENWNESIRLARGGWIKLMHDDDWFTGPGSLEIFAETLKRNPEKKFFFSAFTNVFLDQNTSSPVIASPARRRMLEQNAKTLLSQNVIGPPSVTFHKKDLTILYDPALKWLVDIDFYIRFLKDSRPVFIAENLVNVGLGSEQVTRQVFRNPLVEIPENLYLLDKMGVSSLKSWVVFDAFWRFIRNLNIRSLSQLREAGYDKPIPKTIASMISFQSGLPALVLKTGPISKLLMFIHYIYQYPKIARDSSVHHHR
jgi:glycosyltransferase involved in cell wall biosynthesis